MRKRQFPVQVYLDEHEYKNLQEWAAACRMSMSVYIRELINGFRPIAFPPYEYTQIMADLRKLGINMNQIAGKAHSLGFIDEVEYRRNAQAVWKLCADMNEQIALRGFKFGSNKDMGCEKSSE